MDDASHPGNAAGLLRRLAAIFYDWLLLLALWFGASLAFLPLTGGEAILASTQGWLAHLYHALLLALAAAYFAGSWVLGGQTLGMKAWRLRLQTREGFAPGWRPALLRFGAATALLLLAALGSRYLWAAGFPRARWLGALLLLPALADLCSIALDPAGRSLLDRTGRLRVVRTG